MNWEQRIRVLSYLNGKQSVGPARMLLVLQGTGWAHLNGLVDISNIFCLHICVLLPTAYQLRKSS